MCWDSHYGAFGKKEKHREGGQEIIFKGLAEDQEASQLIFFLLLLLPGVCTQTEPFLNK